MNLINQDVQTLVDHINSIMKRRKLQTTSYAIGDYKLLDESIQLYFAYKFRNELGDLTTIFELGHNISIDEFIDNKEFYIEAGNERLYDEILIHTSFEPDYNNEQLNKYKWN